MRARTAEKASEAAEKASVAASEAAEKASETAKKASRTAEMASEAAKGESSDSSETETAEVVGAGVANAVQNRDGGATAATRAGGKRPTAVRSRHREPVRQPNKRFEGDADGRALGDGLHVDDAVLDGETDAGAPPFERTGFRNPGDAETFREGSER